MRLVSDQLNTNNEAQKELVFEILQILAGVKKTEPKKEGEGKGDGTENRKENEEGNVLSSTHLENINASVKSLHSAIGSICEQYTVKASPTSPSKPSLRPVLPEAPSDDDSATGITEHIQLLIATLAKVEVSIKETSRQLVEAKTEAALAIQKSSQKSSSVAVEVTPPPTTLPVVDQAPMFPIGFSSASSSPAGGGQFSFVPNPGLFQQQQVNNFGMGTQSYAGIGGMGGMGGMMMGMTSGYSQGMPTSGSGLSSMINSPPYLAQSLAPTIPIPTNSGGSSPSNSQSNSRSNSRSSSPTIPRRSSFVSPASTATSVEIDPLAQRLNLVRTEAMQSVDKLQASLENVNQNIETSTILAAKALQSFKPVS
jgi:hypothetical protein